jgi:ATP-dependent Clp protease ATP-binding subunit ClpX
MDNVQLEFDQEALQAIATEAIKRNTGARGLRAIIESVMLDIMFEAPSRADGAKCVINKEAIINKIKPEFVKKDTEKNPKKKEESA